MVYLAFFFLGHILCAFAQEDLGETALVLNNDSPTVHERFSGELVTSQALGDLQDFLQVDLLIQANCSSSLYQEKYKELQFDFRVFASSFYFQEMEALNDWLKSLGESHSSCQENIAQVWRECSKGTGPNRKFWIDAGPKFEKLGLVNEIQEADLSKQNEMIQQWRKTPWGNRWQNDLEDGSRSSLIQRGLKQCHNDLDTIRQLCLEHDQIYGLSQLPWVEEELRKFYSTLGEAYQDNQECLSRFIWENKKFELLPIGMPEVLKSWSSSIQSEHFPMGPLMGLKIIFSFEKAGKVAFEMSPVPTPIAVKKSAVVKIVSPMPTVIPVQIPTPTVQVVKAAPAPRRPAFDLAYAEFMAQKSQKAVKLNPQFLAQDFPEMAVHAADLDEKLSPFQGRDALAQLKSQEGVGTEKTPMALSFLKFFIDRGRHRVLFNVQSVMGEEYWVENDFADNPEKVKMKMEYSSSEGWVLWIIPSKRQ